MTNDTATSATPPANPCIEMKHAGLFEDLEDCAPCEETEDRLGRKLLPEGQGVVIQLTGPEARLHGILQVLSDAGYRRFGTMAVHSPDEGDLSADGICARALGQRIYQVAIGIPVAGDAAPQPELTGEE